MNRFVIKAFLIIATTFVIGFFMAIGLMNFIEWLTKVFRTIPL